MEKTIHIAAQYLAAAGINFIEKTSDDSHTNLGFSKEKKRLFTRFLSKENDFLALNYDTFSIEWVSEKNSDSLPLEGATHKSVLEWLQETSKSKLGKKYSYNFHYHLPYTINDDYIFKLKNKKDLDTIFSLRNVAQTAIEQVLKTNNLTSEIRVWPHHFDTGAFSNLNPDTNIGFGLAIPDSVCKEHYFYISGYKGHEPINTSEFKKTTRGQWKNKGFIGAILPALNITTKEAEEFFNEAIKAYQ